MKCLPIENDCEDRFIITHTHTHCVLKLYNGTFQKKKKKKLLLNNRFSESVI